MKNKKLYTIEKKERGVATIIVSSEGRKVFLLDIIRKLLYEFQKVDIIYDPPVLLNL